MNSCRVCYKIIHAETKRTSYCGKDCSDKGRKIRDKERKQSIRHRERADRKMKSKGCVCHTRSAWPHRFDIDLKCQACGLTWEENQISHPTMPGGFHPCTPEAEAKAIQIELDEAKKREARHEAKRKIKNALDNHMG